jgi:hypothetical protein
LKRVELDAATKDIQKAIELDAIANANKEDPALKLLERQIKAELKKYEEKDKKLFQRMFKAL